MSEIFTMEWFTQLGIMRYPLALCSVLAIAVCFERVVFLFRAIRGKEIEYQNLSYCLTENKSKTKHIRDEIVGIMLNELQRPYCSGIKTLRIIGTLSPILGLLGTILGIITTFKVIAMHTGSVSPNMVADGLWEAMLTTAVGLIIAVFCLLSAHIFRSLGERQLGDFCLRLNKLSMSFEMGKISEMGKVRKTPARKEANIKKPEMSESKLEKLVA